MSALLLGALTAIPAAPPVHLPASVPAAGSGWLTRFNQWRANTGTSILSENTTWSAGDLDHAVYMVKNNLVTHYETPGTPYYTVDGDTAARNSNLNVSSTTSTADEDAIDWWMGAPFHALGMMDPRLTTTGFGSYREVKSGWQFGAALDVLRGNSFSGGSYPVYFPGNGTIEPLTQYSGFESPDPLQACSGYSTPVGLPVFIQVGGNVATTAGPNHSFTGNGAPLAHCVIDSNSPSVGSGLSSRGAVIVVPRSPLQAGVKYTVSLTVNGTPYTWSFSVGPFFGVSGLSPRGGTPAGGTTVTVSGQGFTGATAVMFGAIAATSFSVVNDSTITAVSPAHALGAVDVTVTAPAGTTAITPSDRYTYSTPCTAVTASASPQSPQPSGTQVTITGSATCPSASPLYEFWMLPSGSSNWQLIQGYTTSATYNWNSTGAVAGTETFGVWVHDATSPGIYVDGMGAYDTFASLQFTVGATVCSSVTLSATPASPQTSGTQVTLTASGSGCPNPQYEFWMLAAGTSTWQLLQGYSGSATYTWNSTGALSGTERFGVWLRDASSPAAYDTYTGIPYSVTSSCTSASVSASPTSVTHGTGAHVTITAVATGCSTGARYEFWMRAASQSSWQLVQGYAASASYDWNTTGAAPGTVYFGVWVRDANSGAAYDQLASTTVAVN